MTKKEAEEIIEKWKISIKIPIGEVNFFGIQEAEAKGFLECYSQMEPIMKSFEHIKNELGIPSLEYAAPVANAYLLANEALSAWRKIEGDLG